MASEVLLIIWSNLTQLIDNNVSSNEVEINIGVPQVLVVSPLLF